MDMEAMRSLEWREGVPGKVCAKCGHWKPLAGFNKKLRFVHSWCKECLREAYRAAPKKDKRAYYQAYNKANEEKRRQYRQANRERQREHVRRYITTHSEKLREARRLYQERNKDKKREANRRWRRNNPDKALQKDHRRRARLHDAPGRFTLKEWEALKCAYGHICLACKQPEPAIKLVPDHVIPIARGGANTIDNIQPLCDVCNKRKGARTIDYRDGRDWKSDLG